MAASPATEPGGCPRLEAGTGDFPENQSHAVAYVAQAARDLRVDLTHDVAMIAFPGPIGFDPRYAVRLERQTRGWSLTYVVDKGRVTPSRAFTATVPIQPDLAQRVAQAWQQAIDRADRNADLACLVLDGASYAFSAAGSQAHIAEPKGGVAESMIAIAQTLKSIVLDTKLTGRMPHASQARLENQLDALERILQAYPQHVASSRP